jgi:hypothetical protein
MIRRVKATNHRVYLDITVPHRLELPHSEMAAAWKPHCLQELNEAKATNIKSKDKTKQDFELFINNVRKQNRTRFEIDRLEEKPKGYEGLAQFMGTYPELAIFRRLEHSTSKTSSSCKRRSRIWRRSCIG